MENIFPLLQKVLMVVFVLTIPAAAIECNRETYNVENSLKQHLFCNGYDRTIRPAKSEFDMINITMIPFIKDFNFEPYDNTLRLQISYKMAWQDTSLQWNASDWSNIKELCPNYDEIWFPEFEHINSDFEGDSSLSCSNPHCVLMDTGSLFCCPVCITSAKCFPDYSRWPYNTLSCQMWFANRDKELVDEIKFILKRRLFARSRKAVTSKWCMISFTSNQTSLDIPGATGRSVLLWKFGLQYTPHIELTVMYFPTFAVVILNIFTCWLYPLADEKRKIILMSLVCHFMLLRGLKIMSNEIPGIVLFIIASMVLTLLLFIITLILRWLHDLHTTPPTIVLRLIRVFTNNRWTNWFLQTEYLSLGHKPTTFTNYMELRDWPMIVQLADRCVFVLYIFLYLCLFCVYVPLQHNENSSKSYELCSD